MTRPPSRADEVRRLASSSTTQASAKMTAIDVDNPNIHAEGWFAYVMPTQTGVQMMGSGRYGYWEEQPDVAFDSDWVVITGKDTSEPIFVAPRDNVHTVHVCQGKHIEALPFPELAVPPEQAA